MPKISALAAATALTDDDLLVVVDSPGGIPSTKKVTALNAATYFGGIDQVLEYAISAEDANATTGTAKLTVRAPYDLTLSEVRLSASVASSSGTPTVDINVGGSTILSTKLTLDENERTSTTAATAAVISATEIPEDAEITFDIDVAGTGTRGLKVKMVHNRGIVAPVTITFVNETHTTYASRTNTTITKPTGTADGDYVILGIITGASGGAGGAPDPTPPAGFTLLAGPTLGWDGSFAVELRLYGKIASSEGASWDMTHATASSQGFAVTYNGVDPTTPVDVAGTDNEGTGSTTTATGVTTASNGAMVVYAAHNWGSGTALTAPTGTTPTFTERIDTLLVYVADGLMTTAGATGSKTQSNGNGGGDGWGAILVALRPA